MTDTSGSSADNPTEIVITGTKKTTIPSQIGNTTPFSSSVQIGGNPFPMTAWSVESGAYGSVGHAQVTVSISMLTASKINLVQMGSQQFSGMPVDIYATDATGQQSHIFGGEYVNAEWDYDNDTVSISARDWAGVLVDQKRTLTAILNGKANATGAPDESDTDTTGISVLNVPLMTLVSNIAKLFNLTPVFNPNPLNPNTVIGTLYGDGSDTVMSATAQSLWAILNVLARDSGNEVYVDPDKNLVFGTPGGNTPIPLLSLSYKVNPVPSGALPIRRPRVTHNVRRNSSFRVLVLSYNPANAQITQGEAYVIGDGLTTGGNQVISPGSWSGNNASLISNSLIGQDKKFPLYTFHIDGLTAQQAQTRATAIATDIAKREFIVTCVADIIPLVRPMNHVKISGALDAAFIGQDYYVNRYKHTYKMPKGSAGGEGAGMMTELTLLNIQQEGSGSPLTKTATNK